jgi:hypothetical protein
MKRILTAATVLSALACGSARGEAPGVLSSVEARRNNLVSGLLEVASVPPGTHSFTFTRPGDGWVFVTASCRGRGTVRVGLEGGQGGDMLAVTDAGGGRTAEAVRLVAKGEHRLRVECPDGAGVDALAVRAIPELMHCGLGFDPAIRSYGRYDMRFLARDVLPNVTTLVVPSNIKLDRAVIDDWHRQGKRFVAEVGVSGQAETAEAHARYWGAALDSAPFLDGVIVNEFIVNNPAAAPGRTLSPERQARMDRERQRYKVYGEAIKQFRASERYRGKGLYAYVGGSGKRLNQEVIGPDFIRTILDCGYRVALERYLFEVSSESKADAALRAFADGIADWEAKEPGVKRQMVIAFGLFSMPPGGLNKQANVDYHVWMDRQMNVVANDPALAGVGGLEWWTSLQADEETVRFVGKLYRHYAIVGKTSMLTRDPLFLTHVRNADFEQGLGEWTLRPAEFGSIRAGSFPRYGRIEGRYMGLGRPADPEHVGDTFLVMTRSAKGPNSFSQTVKGLEPGRLYSMKMFSCDYNDLIHPAKKEKEQATGFLGGVTLSGVELDEARSFTEMYASNPEPPIPVWITYHWKVFRAKGPTAELTVSDWPAGGKPPGPFGQDQTFNFVEIEPYHE